MESSKILTRGRLWLIAALIAVGFIALFTIEALNNRYLRSDSSGNNNRNLNNRENFNVPVELEQQVYPNINTYLTEVEDKYVYDAAMKQGCYDNDRLMEQIRGPGKTCKSVGPSITDANYKPTAPTLDDVRGQNPNYFVTGDGEVVSYAEICPTTSKQEHPIRCLHEKAKKLDTMGKRVANVIDHVQRDQDRRLGNLDSTASQHIVDNQRLFNQSHTSDFLKYERALDIPQQTTDANPASVLVYAANKRAAAL